MDNTYLIEIVTANTVLHKLAFATKEAAVAQLDLIEPKIGFNSYNRNDVESIRHRISSDDGELLILMSDVKSVRLVDMKAYNELIAYAVDFYKQADIDYEKAKTAVKQN